MHGDNPITAWSVEDRPREKLLERGEEALTKAELLAILIGSGTPRKSAVALMQEVMDDCEDRLLLFSRLTIDELTAYDGIGTAKAVTLRAAVELGRRRYMEEAAADLPRLCEPDAIYRYMRPRLGDTPHEECWVLLFNQSARLIKMVRVSQGGRTETIVDVREVLKKALVAGATSLVLVHNHPSGSSQPSPADEQVTRRLADAARTVSLRLLDHIVVSDGSYYSFANQGKL